MNLKTRTSFLSFFIAISLIGRADTLYFIATPDQNHDVNFDFFSPNNWYVPNGMGGYDSAPHNPTSEDDVILVTSANAAANSVVFVSMTLQSGVHVSGGGFSVGTLVTTSGNSFTSSSVEVRNAWHLSNGCSMSMGTITVDSGAFLEMEPGSASLTLDTSTLYVVGQIVMSAGSLINFANGTNQFWIRPNAVVSGSGSTAIYVNPNSGNSISFYFDGTLESDGGLMNISLGNGAWLNTQGLAKLRTSVPNGIIEIHGAMAVPAGATNQVVGPGVTRLYADSTIATVNGLLQVGAVDPDTMVLDPGTLEMDRVLTGSGLTQTISSNGMPSTIIWGNGTVSMPVNIDAWGRLLITNASPKVLSACTLNNAGTAEWDTDGGDLHLNNGAVFNNLSGATFDARNNAALYGGVGAIGKFVNAGEFRKSAGSGSTAVVQENPPAQGAIFNNTGTVNARTGRIVLMGGTNAGAFNMDAGTEIRISAFTNHQVAGSSFSGP
ncbi:MAG TPA: hypothetical protein VHH88_02535, partial [Verrucomicrobiae bacterium]|nr:hypothetical protein [Verrucomicrobiae bacterium]